MKNYFIKTGDKESGPFTLEQLKSASLQRDTLVWHAGLKGWTAAANTYEMKELFEKKLSFPRFSKYRFKRIWRKNKRNDQRWKVS
ncbi:MAG: DUF4339 domain-containing protein [Ginsengibacter sp.]